MAEAPKTTKGPAPKGPVPKGQGGKPVKGPNPLMPVIAIALILAGALWLTYSIVTEPPPPKRPGGH